MKLALFDLDHTLIPFDSGGAWTRYLIAAGRLPAAAEDEYLRYARQYVAGQLDIREMHRAAVRPIAGHGMAMLRAWARDFEQGMAPRLPASTQALVREHQAHGDLCAIVTATTRFVAEPFARLFGIGHLLATEAALEPGSEAEVAGGRPSGEIEGEPCYRGFKVDHVQRWLAGLGRGLADFEASVFYSDSASDLPLLETVSEPVAVWPDPRLRARAEALGWRVLEPARS